MTSTASDEHDRDRLAQCVKQHARAIRGFLLALVRRGDVADDLLQETFRRAWQARDRYVEAGRERSYLLRIADRLAVDYTRRKGNSEATLDDDAWQVAEPSSREASPEQMVMVLEQRQVLEQALELLNESQRRVLLLRFYGDLEFAEIAETLSCPLGTVLSHCHRALSKLRIHLADHLP